MLLLRRQHLCSLVCIAMPMLIAAQKPADLPAKVLPERPRSGTACADPTIQQCNGQQLDFA
jgi:hypothetical protein